MNVSSLRYFNLIRLDSIVKRALGNSKFHSGLALIPFVRREPGTNHLFFYSFKRDVPCAIFGSSEKRAGGGRVIGLNFRCAPHHLNLRIQGLCACDRIAKLSYIPGQECSFNFSMAPTEKRTRISREK